MNGAEIFTLVFALVVVALFFVMFFTALEEVFAAVFNRPFYVHFYLKKLPLSSGQEYVLRNSFPFYRRLSEMRKGYFRHRVATFIQRYQFIGKHGFVVTEDVKILVAAHFVMLTFGMRKYLYEVFDKIVIYPESYLSTVTNQYHKGEFNPRVKAVVFSWEDFMLGISDDTDNMNLAIHEFSHVLHYHGSKYEDSSALIFARMYKRITDEVMRPNNRDRLINSDYFRLYGYSNQFEFLAVIIEHYFETPDRFRREFPELYQNVSRMLNHRHR